MKDDKLFTFKELLFSNFIICIISVFFSTLMFLYLVVPDVRVEEQNKICEYYCFKKYYKEVNSVKWNGEECLCLYQAEKK